MENTLLSSEINNHQSALQNFALHFTRNLDDANDLVQDTFVKALRYSHLYEKGTNLQGWLYTIMKNTFINNYKRKTLKNQMIETSEELYSFQLIKSAASNLGVGTLVEEDINKALQKLNPLCLIPFIKYFEGYKYHEIAAELDIPIGTVKTRIHEARKYLKKDLKMYKPSAA